MCSDVAFTPDGRRVVAVAMQRIILWDVATGTEQDAFERDTRADPTASPSRPTADGSRLPRRSVSASQSSTSPRRGDEAPRHDPARSDPPGWQAPSVRGRGLGRLF